MYDMHCHLDLMPSMQTVARDALKNKLNILAVTTTPKAYEKEINLLKDFNNIRVALGLHPQLIKERYSELSIVEQYIESANYIGEIGLDFGRQYYSSKEKQIEVFDKIIYWSALFQNKIISIHSVKADKHVVDILVKHSCFKNNICILHWFSGSLSQLERAINLGCYFSINLKMLDSPNGKALLSRMPADRILLESDAPFISNIQTGDQLYSALDMTLERLQLDGHHLSLDQINTLSARMFVKSSC
jgi:TatD DNase family protein